MRLVADLMQHLKDVPYPGRDLVPEAPSAYYLFAGEIPWSPQFGKPDPTYGDVDSYTGSVTVRGRTIEMEMVAHSYAWEDYHSVTNQAAPAMTPSKLLSTVQKLHGVPQCFDQVDPAGAGATMTVGPPDGFAGELLYIREDVLRAYAGNRALVFFGWGERRLHSTWPDQPSDMVRTAYQKHQNVWRVIKESRRHLADRRQTANICPDKHPTGREPAWRSSSACGGWAARAPAAILRRRRRHGGRRPTTTGPEKPSRATEPLPQPRGCLPDGWAAG